jgi:hypothetical protein
MPCLKQLSSPQLNSGTASKMLTESFTSSVQPEHSRKAKHHVDGCDNSGNQITDLVRLVRLSTFGQKL